VLERLQVIKLEHINELRGEANKLLELIRASSSGLMRRSLRTQLELKREVIDSLLRKWWEQEGM
jgi:hypothetical protein